MPGAGGMRGSPSVPAGSSPRVPSPLAQHLHGDEQRVQGRGLLRGRHGLAAGLQLADGNPADALEGLVGLHLLQGDDEDVALLVFDGLEEDLPQVLDAQKPLHTGMGDRRKVRGHHAACWKPGRAPTDSPQTLHVLQNLAPGDPRVMARLWPSCSPVAQSRQSWFFSSTPRGAPPKITLGGIRRTGNPPPPLTCICEMASSILKRVCRMQEQDDWETVTHCRSHRISSHMHDTCSTARSCHHQPSPPSSLLTRGGPGDSRSVPLHPSWARKVRADTAFSSTGDIFYALPCPRCLPFEEGHLPELEQSCFQPPHTGKGCSGGAPHTVTPLEDTALTAVAAQISQRQDAQHRARGLPTLVNQRKSCMSRHE